MMADETELVERARFVAGGDFHPHSGLLNDLADAIEALQRERDAMREALVIAEPYLAAAAEENRGTDGNAESKRELATVRAALSGD